MKHSSPASLKFEALATAQPVDLDRLLDDFLRQRTTSSDMDEAMVIDCLNSMRRLSSELLADYEPIREDERDLLLMYVLDLFLSTLYRCYLEGMPDTGPKSFAEFCRRDLGPQWMDMVNDAPGGRQRSLENVRQTTHTIFGLLVHIVGSSGKTGNDVLLASGVLYSILSDAFGLPLDVSAREAEDLSKCYERITQSEDEAAVERASNIVVRAMLRNGRELGHGEGEFRMQAARGLPPAKSVRYLSALSFYALAMRLNRIRAADPEFFYSLNEGFRQLDDSDQENAA